MTANNSHPLIIPRFCICYKQLNEALVIFPKNQRYTLGEKLENTAIEILELLIKGNREPEQRALLLNQADVKLELLKVLLKMAAETRALNLKTAGILSAGLEEIGRMLGGWIRATKQSAS